MKVATTIESISNDWGGCMFDGTVIPLIYLGARTIFHQGKSDRQCIGYERNRKGEVRREYKGGPPLRKYKYTETPAHLEWLGDRKNWAGTVYDQHEDFEQFKETPQFKAFKLWLDATMADGLQKQLDRWSGSSSEVFESHAGILHFRASANQSHGYVYLAAWMDERLEEKQ